MSKVGIIMTIFIELIALLRISHLNTILLSNPIEMCMCYKEVRNAAGELGYN